MAKPGRNDRCSCGSGKKYKSCCLTKDETAAREQLAKAQAHSPDRRMQEFEAAIAQLAVAGDDGSGGDELMNDSNAVLDLIRAGKLDEAEASARALLAQYPDVHDGWDRLGMVHEARGETAQAVDCYRKIIVFLEQNPDYSEPAFKDAFVERIAKLDPPAAG
jgi:tetratricopeptide (TPR) repeat protein